ncbi:DNA-3-methyladenine glycosylase [Nocardioides nitrophenolicus]|uniref:DNA-3-methyladenine glycosylase n=1 Tax=Nocardioides nitrophenolicus TaxID=60489 RepID=UPI0019565987|nr:DNA-3-methyladenine glycosylase [Nocardioides nitrophenolicus]MBM7516310.1 DNA-3-methyladenine glycosylase [Nocardioides nitrophenolicus]
MSAADRADVVRRARALLGRTIVGHGVSVRITEVEAYGGREDPASHAFTRTPRSEIMYGPAYRLYVYRSYGIHLCANVVTGPTEIGAAVLLRAGRVVEGVELARFRRGETPPERDDNLARGPGNLAQALGITLDDLGTDLLAAHDGGDFTGVRLGPETRAARGINSGPRVGVSKAADVPWRFWLDGDPTVSAYKRSPRAPKAADPTTLRP